MSAIGGFCARLDLPEDQVRDLLNSDEPRPGGSDPWYVVALLGLAGWITALMVMTLGLAIVFVALDLTDPQGTLGALGVLFVGGGALLGRRDSAGLYRAQLAVSTMAGGCGLIVAEAGLSSEEVSVAALVAAVMAVIAALRAAPPVLQILLTAGAVFLAFASLIFQGYSYYLDMTAMLTLPGVLLLTIPPRQDMRATAITTLAAVVLLQGLFADDYAGLVDNSAVAGGWIGRLIHLALVLCLAGAHWRVRGARDHILPTLAILAVAVVVCLLLPPGGSAACVILALAYVLGSRLLALLGVVAAAVFIWQFYYDLATTLLVKSLLAGAVGLVLLLLWALLQRRPRTEGAT